MHQKNHIKIYQTTTIFFKFEVIKKQIFASEKMRNPGNCIHDYACSFFEEYFQSNALYWLGSRVQNFRKLAQLDVTENREELCQSPKTGKTVEIKEIFRKSKE